MNKFFKFFLVLTVFLCVAVNVTAYAVYENDLGEYYSMPDGYATVAEVDPLNISHYYYYEWVLEDFDAEVELTSIDIVFHAVHDWTVEDDTLAVYIRDGLSSDVIGSWDVSWDFQDPTNPDWSSWDHLGTWSDPVGHEPWQDGPTYDVAFSIFDEDILSYLQNGGSFVIGIDPDCHYYGESITVNAPVPEPLTILMLGMGLFGFAGTRRKKKE